MTPTLRFYKLHPEVTLPKIATEGSACFDVEYHPSIHKTVKVFNYRYHEDHDDPVERILSVKGLIYLEPMERALLPTGLKAEIPDGYHVKAYPRSSVALKRGIPIVNCTGVIDSDYVDEWFVPIINLNHRTIYLEPHERLIQVELVKNTELVIEEMYTPPEYTTRFGGFGSTGK